MKTPKAWQPKSNTNQDPTLRKGEPDTYKTILNLPDSPVLDRMDETLRRIREASKSLEAFNMFRQNTLWACLKCGRKHKVRYRAQECHYFFVRVTEVGYE